MLIDYKSSSSNKQYVTIHTLFQQVHPVLKEISIQKYAPLTNEVQISFNTMLIIQFYDLISKHGLSHSKNCTFFYGKRALDSIFERNCFTQELRENRYYTKKYTSTQSVLNLKEHRVPVKKDTIR